MTLSEIFNSVNAKEYSSFPIRTHSLDDEIQSQNSNFVYWRQLE